MMPIGLKFKNLKENPFTNRINGELMVVLACLGCNKISANRIAGDDNSYKLLQILDNPCTLNYNITRMLTKKVLIYSPLKIGRM